MENKGLDLKDRRILSLLDVNSRQPNSKIAKQVGLSKDVVNYRIKKLEEGGFIKGYYTVIDFSKFEYFSIRVYLKLLDTSLEQERKIIDYLVKNKNVFFVAEIEGLYDIGLGTWVKDIYEFEKFWLEFKKKFKKHIGKDQLSIFTKAYHFHRAYILEKKKDEIKPEIFGGNKTIELDEKDISILKLLAQNARIPIIDISDKLDIPPRTVDFRIKQMERKDIIQGYRFIFNFSLFGYEYYKVDLNLKDITRLNELIDYAKTHPNIIYIDQTIGGSDFEFDLEVKSKQEFLEIMKDLRKKFPEIRNWHYFTATEYPKLLYFPDI
ncbi:MAG: Lrp/AsnC family transcriptional regulator [Patescibacteria group bacterium]